MCVACISPLCRTIRSPGCNTQIVPVSDEDEPLNMVVGPTQSESVLYSIQAAHTAKPASAPQTGCQHTNVRLYTLFVVEGLETRAWGGLHSVAIEKLV